MKIIWNDKSVLNELNEYDLKRLLSGKCVINKLDNLETKYNKKRGI